MSNEQKLSPIAYAQLKGVDAYLEWKQAEGFLQDLKTHFAWAHDAIVLEVMKQHAPSGDSFIDGMYAAADMVEEILAKSNNSLFRSGAKILAGNIRAAANEKAKERS